MRAEEEDRVTRQEEEEKKKRRPGLFTVVAQLVQEVQGVLRPPSVVLSPAAVRR